MSTYTPSNGFEMPAVGTEDNTWGGALNNDFDLIDQAADGVAVITLSSGSYALTVSNGALSNGRCKIIQFSGSPGGSVAVSVSPSNIQKWYWIVNDTSQSLNFTNGSGSSFTVSAGATSPIFCDGSGNVVGLQAGTSTFSSIVATTGNIGTLTVPTQANLPVGANVNIGSQTLTAFIDSLIPTLTLLNGNLVISTISSVAVTSGGGNGAYTVFVFGNNPGTRIVVAIGIGVTGTGSSGFFFTIPVPSGYGFPSTPNLAGSAVNLVGATAGNITSFSSSASGGGVTTSATQSSSGTPNCGSMWWALVFSTGY